MGLNKLLAGALIGLVSCGALAESEWKLLTTSDSGFAVFLKEDSIEKLNKNSIDYYQATHKFWSKAVVIQDLVKDGLAVGDYLVSLQLVNCNDKTMGIKSITSFIKQKNGIIDSNTVSNRFIEMKEVIPDSRGNDAVNIVCSSDEVK